MAGTQWGHGTYIDQATFANQGTKWDTITEITLNDTSLDALSAGSAAVGKSGSAVRSLQDSVTAIKQRTHKIISSYANKRIEFHDQYKCAGIRYKCL